MISTQDQHTDVVDALLGEVATEFSERIAPGETPDIEEYAEKYPQIAQMIRDVFPALNLLKSSQDESLFSKTMSGSVRRT